VSARLKNEQQLERMIEHLRTLDPEAEAGSLREIAFAFWFRLDNDAQKAALADVEAIVDEVPV